MASASSALKDKKDEILKVSFGSGESGGTIDILNSYPWIADEAIGGVSVTGDVNWSSDSERFNVSNKKNNVPFCYAVERVSAVNASIANVANMIHALGDQADKLAGATRNATNAMNINTGDDTIAGKAIAAMEKGIGAVKDTLNTLKEKFDFNKLLAENNLSSNIFSPYKYLYITKPSGKKFVFPLANNDSSFGTIKNKWGAVKKLPGFLEQTLGAGIQYLKQGAVMLNFMDNITKGAQGESSELDNVIDEVPKSYSYPQDGDMVNVNFTLYNTTKLNAWKTNYRFLLLFVLRNLPMRVDAFSFTPPVLYDVIIPGVKRLPVCAVETFKVLPKGMIRSLTCDNFIKGSGTLTVNVPEAWEVNIVFKSLIGASANMVLSEFNAEIVIDSSKDEPKVEQQEVTDSDAKPGEEVKNEGQQQGGEGDQQPTTPPAQEQNPPQNPEPNPQS